MSVQKFPEPVVGAFIFNKEKKLFLVRSHKWKNKYVVPGGHVELGETLEDALTREIKEETGFEISHIQPINIIEFIFDKSFVKKKHFIFHNFSATTNTLDAKLNDEAQGYIWVFLKDALKLPLQKHTRQTIELLLRKK